LAPTPQNAARELIVRDLEGKTITVPLNRDRIVLGRSTSCELCYPDDAGLSRQHMALVRTGNDWRVEDLGSKNGTLLNGRRLEAPTPFRSGDRITAGHLIIEFADIAGLAPETVVFVENEDSFSTTATTVVANLDGVLGHGGLGHATPGPQLPDVNQTTIMQGNPQMRALIRAGRELSEHRPLGELFQVIMDLSIEAVMAGRGVLMTIEDNELHVRAARGEGFKISSTVRDRVIQKKESLLVRDAQMDHSLKAQMSIVEQKVRSMIAVPLQTNDRVIGLIYVDQPHLVREFSREDLNLLTVMANVAAIRIEHVRLNEVEEAERAMAKDMQQAALIQNSLLPGKAPVVAGLDIAGKTTACRTVGGDYYDFLKFPDGRVGLLVGDVAGKGMPASLMMSSLHARVHVLFEDGDDLAQKLTRLNKSTCQNCPDNRFITFFITVADPATGELVYANAGHNPPLLVRAAGGFETLGGGGMILGILPKAAYSESRAAMQPGDVLILFTDGVTEAADPSGEEFGEDRLAALVASMLDCPAAEIVEAIHTAVAEYTQGAPAADDITVVAVRRL
jgi:serine phosphatase RsbU (regulator of sigma subunit)/pSer/pThr/pTyr-binding forkhead associated (FHA) protein